MSDKIGFRSSSIAFGDDSIIPRGHERGWREPKPPTPSPTLEPVTDLDDIPSSVLLDVPPQVLIDRVECEGKGLYKRMVVVAIPRTEEVVAVRLTIDRVMEPRMRVARHTQARRNEQ